MKRPYQLVIVILVLFSFSKINHAIHVHILNMLDDGQSIKLHCRSKDDDIGNFILEQGEAAEWSFSINFWGTTLFYCDMQFSNSSKISYHFDAFSTERDWERCYSKCRWIISEKGSLYGYDQQLDQWNLFPLTKI